MRANCKHFSRSYLSSRVEHNRFHACCGDLHLCTLKERRQQWKLLVGECRRQLWKQLKDDQACNRVPSHDKILLQILHAMEYCFAKYLRMVQDRKNGTKWRQQMEHVKSCASAHRFYTGLMMRLDMAITRCRHTWSKASASPKNSDMKASVDKEVRVGSGRNFIKSTGGNRTFAICSIHQQTREGSEDGLVIDAVCA